VMDGRAAIHVTGQPLLPVSTELRTLDTLVDCLRSVAAKSQPEPTQSVAGRPWGCPIGRPMSPFDLWFGSMWSTCHKHSCGDTIFGRILNVLVIS
jgi:hypothetical protein